MQKYIATRGHLSDSWTTIIKADDTLLPGVNLNLERYVTITEVQLAVVLPSLSEWAFVPDGTVTLEEQEFARTESFNSQPGINLQIRIGGLEIPIPNKLVNTPGGFWFSLIPQLGVSRESIFLNPLESLELRLSAPLGASDYVTYESLSLVWVEELE